MIRASLVAQMVKNPPVRWETWAWSLGWEDPLEEGMATHSSILAWRSPMDREALRAAVHRVAESDTTERLSTAQHSTCNNKHKCENKRINVLCLPSSQLRQQQRWFNWLQHLRLIIGKKNSKMVTLLPVCAHWQCSFVTLARLCLFLLPSGKW